jgi:hypothetical protein
MALVLADRVLETSTTSGSGTITLAGAKPGYQSFSVVGNGNTTYYTIAGVTEWEVGIGTYTASGTTLSRDTVLASSAGGAKVTFSAGIKDVFVDYPAGRAVFGNETGTVVVANLNATSAVITTLSSSSANITTLTGTTFGTTATTQFRGASATITTITGTSANITTITEAGSPVVVQTDIGSAPNEIPLNQYLGDMAYQSSDAVSVSNLVATSATITTLTGTNFSATSLTLTNALGRAQGGTGLSTAPTNGQLLIGNGSGYTLATLTAGSGMTITNGTGTITLAAGGLPPVTVSNTTTISAVAGNHYVLTAASLTTVTLPASPTISDTIYVTVANGLTTNVVARNGKPIQGIAEDMTLDTQYASAQLRFTDDTNGWVMA